MTKEEKAKIEKKLKMKKVLTVAAGAIVWAGASVAVFFGANAIGDARIQMRLRKLLEEAKSLEEITTDDGRTLLVKIIG